MRHLLPSLLLLVGCPFVGSGGYDDRVRDIDGDGSFSVRFGGPDCRDDDATITDCDADRDGFLAINVGGTDCDDADASIHPEAEERCNSRDDDCDGAIDNNDDSVVSDTTVWVDADGDGSGDPSRPLDCQEFDGDVPIHATDDDDCDDDDPGIRPGVDELCDGFDNNCDGAVDDAGTWFIDADNDGFGRDDQLGTGPCDLEPGAGLSAIPGDCDDDDASIYLGAPEIPYDGIDGNCNGGLDDWDMDQDGAVPAEHFAAASAASLLEHEPWGLTAGDCDDTDPRRFDGNTEVCDGVDNDCDSSVDADDLVGSDPSAEATLRSQVVQRYVDADGDGAFGTQIQICPLSADPLLHATTSDDCFDDPSTPGFGAAAPSSVFPGAEEICDGVDNDCNGRIDWAEDSFTGSSLHWLDADGDGVGAAEVQACAPSGSVVVYGDDCNDGDDEVFPGAIEVCGDGKRQDCVNASLFDCDADGFEGLYGGGGNGSDCNDVVAEVFPSDAPGAELCDGIDNDCDDLIDSADTDNLDAADEPFWFPDVDGDGFGATGATGVQQCDRPDGHVLQATDCDDSDAARSPDTVWYADNDSDGYGAAATATESCVSPFPGAVLIAGDCDDADLNLTPNTRWLRDDDGDFLGGVTPVGIFCTPPPTEPWFREAAGVDCDDEDPLVTAGQVWYYDADFDGFGLTSESVESCVAPVVPNARYVINGGDCDDEAANINPAATEICNATDDDCDDDIDDEDTSLVAGFGGPIGYIDDDGDGFGTSIAKAFCVAVPFQGWATATGDCADDEPAINPNANEVCGNGIDDDCDGEEQVPVWYADGDADGFGIGAGSAPHCTPPAPTGFASRDGDCDDENGDTFPGAGELDACDAIDSDCDGTPEPRLTWRFDRDGDTYGDDATAQISCSAPLDPPTPGELGAWVLTGGDCDDLDESTTFGQIWYLDADGDGLGNDASTQFECPQFDDHDEPLTVFLETDVDGDGQFDPLDGDRQLTAFAGDCNDDQPAIGAARNFYPDGDSDDWGDANTPPVLGCPDGSGNPPAGFVTRAGDCDDIDPAINPEAVEIDGDHHDTNCDGFLDNEQGIQWFPDLDGDGLGDRNAAATPTYVPGLRANNVDCDDQNAAIGNGRWVFPDLDGDGTGAGVAFFVGRCELEDGEALSDNDCNDADDATFPGAPEVCDYADNDCDGDIDDDEAGPDLREGFVDADGDGEGIVAAFYCQNAPAGFTAQGGDCNDDDPAVNTVAAEVCDGIDNDCDGTTDPTTPWYLDADGDSYGGAITVNFCAPPSAVWIAQTGDCDDADSGVFPTATVDSCDGIDNNCTGLSSGEVDQDGDGVLLCAGDCDDTSPFRAPGLLEVCDGIADNDCNGLTQSPEGVNSDGDAFDLCDDPDDFDPNVPTQSFTWYLDHDGDGYGDALTFQLSPTPPAGHVLDATDCDDDDPTVHPAAPELCDAIDNDCIPTNEPIPPVWFLDADGDGYGAGLGTAQCEAPGSDYILGGSTDCDDTEQLRNPGMNEICDGGILDNDCNGATTGPELVDTDADGFTQCTDPDDNDPDIPVSTQLYTWHLDADGDGFGHLTNTLASTVQPAGYVLDGTDCDDGEATVHPAATELCDGIDNDCVPGNEPTPPNWYQDLDGDGYGAGNAFAQCVQPGLDYVIGFSNDCDDAEALRNPGMNEICDGGILDNDCNGATPGPESIDADVDGFDSCVDPDDTDPANPFVPDWYLDDDGDGYGDGPPVPGFTAPAHHVANADDCDDSDAAIRPGVAERCNGVDDNCDGATVEGSFDVSNPFTGTGLSGAAADLFIGDLDTNGSFSAGSMVALCSVSENAVTTLQVPGDSFPLRHVNLPGLELATDCEFGGGVGQVYMQDTDLDGVPGYIFYTELLTGLMLDCSSGPQPFGFAPLTDITDCAPQDPDRFQQAGSTNWEDADGDGYRVPLDPFVCAGVMFTDPGAGVDCSDAHTDGTAGVTNDPISVSDSDALNGLLTRCTDATLVLENSQMVADFSVVSPGANLTLEGNGAAGCETSSLACVQAVASAPPTSAQLRFVNLGLEAIEPIQWTFDSAQTLGIRGSTVRNISFAISLSTALVVEDSTLFSSFDNGSFPTNETEILVAVGGTIMANHVRLAGDPDFPGEGAAVALYSGVVDLQSVEIEHKEVGVDVSGGLALLEDVEMTEIQFRAVHATGGDVQLQGLRVPYDPGLDIALETTNTASLDCTDCELGAFDHAAALQDSSSMDFFDSHLYGESGVIDLRDSATLLVDGGAVESNTGRLMQQGGVGVARTATFHNTSLRTEGTQIAIASKDLFMDNVELDTPNAPSISVSNTAIVQLFDVTAVTEQLVLANNVHTVDIMNLDLTTTDVGQGGVRMRGSSDLLITNSTITGPTDSALLVENTSSMTVEGLDIDVEGTGIRMIGAISASVDTSVIRGGERAVWDSDVNGGGITFTDVTLESDGTSGQPVIEIYRMNLTLVRSTMWSEAGVPLIVSDRGVNINQSTLHSGGGAPMFDLVDVASLNVNDSVLDWEDSGPNLILCEPGVTTVNIDNIWLDHEAQIGTGCPQAVPIGPSQDASHLGSPFYDADHTQLWPPIANAYGREGP